MFSQLPEVPNMNKNMQTFVGVQPDIQKLDLNPRSQSAHTSLSKQTEWHPAESQGQGELRHSEVAYQNYIASPRTECHEPPGPRGARGHSAAAMYYPKLEKSVLHKKPKRTLGDVNRLGLDNLSLHKVLANARKCHLRRLGELPRDKLLGLMEHQDTM